MIVGEDVAILVKDHARPEALLAEVAFPSIGLTRPPLKEMVEKIVERRVIR